MARRVGLGVLLQSRLLKHALLRYSSLCAITNEKLQLAGGWFQAAGPDRGAHVATHDWGLEHFLGDSQGLPGVSRGRLPGVSRGLLKTKAKISSPIKNPRERGPKMAFFVSVGLFWHSRP